VFFIETLVGELNPPSLFPPTVSSFLVALGEFIRFFAVERLGLLEF
jgi:hypothetical protein